MFLADILIEGVQRFSDAPEAKTLFQSFEGDSVVLDLQGDKVVTFTVKDGRPVVLQGEVEDPSTIAEIDALEFTRFIDGRTHFAQLFTTEFSTYFKVRKGEFYDLGGDFMLLAPFSDRFIKLYREDPEFRISVEAYASSRPHHQETGAA